MCTPLVLGHGAHHLAGDLADGGAVLRQVGLAAAGVGKQDLTHVAHHQRQRQLLRSIAVVAVALLFGRFVDALGRKAPAQDAAGLFYAKVAVQHPRRVADEGEGKLGPLCGLCHHAGRGTHHAGQPHAAQSGQGLQVAGQVFPGDRVVKGRQEDHDQRVLPFAQLVKIIARCGGGIKGKAGDGGAHQMF